MRTLLFVIALSLTPLGNAQQADLNYDWAQKRDRDGIKIFTSKVPGSAHKAVRGEMEVAATVPELVALLNDLPRWPEWADLCKTSEVLKVISPQELYVHTYNKTPFPIKNRDVVAHMRWTRDEQTGRVSMFSEAVGKEVSESLKPKSKHAVRVHSAFIHWHFTPLDNGRVRVENYTHIDPNGPIPAWLSNLMLIKTPFKTMRNLRELVETGEYQGIGVAF